MKKIIEALKLITGFVIIIPVAIFYLSSTIINWLLSCSYIALRYFLSSIMTDE